MMNTDYQAARLQMLESQIRPNKVTNPALLQAFSELPREQALPESIQPFAYLDDALSLGEGRCLLAPMVLARLLQEADIRAEDVVLDIGCTTGYSTAVIAQLAGTVIGLEESKKFVTLANQYLRDTNIDNAVTVQGPLAQGCRDHAPYNVILINGAVTHIPDIVMDQLTKDGRLITLLQSEERQEAVLLTRTGETITRRVLFESGSTVLPGFEQKEAFRF